MSIFWQFVMFQNMLSRHYLFLCNQFLAQFSMQSFETLQNSCTYIEDMYLILYICLKNLHYYFALFDLLVHVTFNTLTTAISIQIDFVYNDKWYCIYSTLYIFISVSPYGPVTQREFLQNMGIYLRLHVCITMMEQTFIG